MTTSQLALRQKHGQYKAYKRSTGFINRYYKQLAKEEDRYQRELALRIIRMID